MTNDNHTLSTSLIVRLDPRVKLFCSILLSIQLFASTDATPLIFVAVVLTLAVFIARIPFRILVRRLTSVAVFILVILVLNLFTISGEVLFELLGMYATREGLNLGMMLSARIVLVLLSATIFVQTTSIASIIDGIESSLLPVRRRVGAIMQVLAIALNFVPLLIQTARQIKKAQIARGAEPDRNIIRQLQFAFSAALPLFAMTLRSSEHLAQAMEARCYDPSAERSLYNRLTTSFKDWCALVVVIGQFTFSMVVHAGIINLPA